MKRTNVLAMLVVSGALSMTVVQAQSDAAAIRIDRVRDNLYVITGGRGSGPSANTISGNTTGVYDELKR